MAKRSPDLNVEAARRLFEQWGAWRASIGEGWAKPTTQKYEVGTRSDFDHSDPVFKLVCKLQGRQRTRQMFCEAIYKQLPTWQGRVVWLRYVEGFRTLKQVSQIITFERRDEAMRKGEYRILHETFTEPCPGTVANTAKVVGRAPFCPVPRPFTHEAARHAHKHALNYAAKCLADSQKQKLVHGTFIEDLRILMKAKKRDDVIAQN